MFSYYTTTLCVGLSSRSLGAVTLDLTPDFVMYAKLCAVRCHERGVDHVFLTDTAMVPSSEALMNAYHAVLQKVSADGKLRFLLNLGFRPTEVGTPVYSRVCGSYDMATLEEIVKRSDSMALSEKELSYHVDIQWGFDPFLVVTSSEFDKMLYSIPLLSRVTSCLSSVSALARRG
jgi:hypothetical protein